MRRSTMAPRSSFFTMVLLLTIATVSLSSLRCKTDAAESRFKLTSFKTSNLADQQQQVASATREMKRIAEAKAFKTINRRRIISCQDPNPFLSIATDVQGSQLADHQNVTVTVSGVLKPSKLDWIGVVSPSNSQMSICPQNEWFYLQTGDTSSLPLTCHYPVKFQYVSQDPGYLPCSHSTCSKGVGPVCVVKTCSGSVTFNLINIRTDMEFIFFSGGFDAPCILKQTNPVRFANPKAPLYGHLSGVDSTGTTMRLTWVSGSSQPQTVQYANGQSAQSMVTTFQRSDMCGNSGSPASDFGWHDPGFIHSTVMTGLSPSSTYSYKYGSNGVGWSANLNFKTPPAAGSSELKFIAFGDMGKAPLDNSVEHYIQPGSLSVINAVAAEVSAGNVDVVFHIGDISYATGFLAEWDYFLDLIVPVASRVSYMTAIGNHERDHPDSGSVYPLFDSGGECGVPYEKYFQMPAQGQDKPWYSFEAGPVHFTVMSTENDWNSGSEQYTWIQNDFASVNRGQTPWLVFTGHRPQYSSVSRGFLPAVDPSFTQAIEPLLLQSQVDLALWGHVHNYERTCALYQGECVSNPLTDKDGVHVYQSNNYTAPVHAVIGMAGFSLDGFTSTPANWSLSRISNYGYVRVDATTQQLLVEFVLADGRGVADSFKMLK